MDLDIEPAWNPGDANMNIEEFRGLVEKRRSTRGYDETREVSDDMIKTILDCARWAPSGGNGQPWEFIVVRERAVRYKIADFYMKQLEPTTSSSTEFRRMCWRGWIG